MPDLVSIDTFNLQGHYAHDTSGVGQTMWMVILGRAVSGIGGAGIMTVSSIIITGMLKMLNQDHN